LKHFILLVRISVLYSFLSISRVEGQVNDSWPVLADGWKVQTQVVDEPGWCLWGASPAMDKKGNCYLFISRWPDTVSSNIGWRKYSEIALYRASKPSGPYTYVKTILKGNGTGWDAYGMHNPCIKRIGKKWVLCFIANDWKGGLDKHGPNQRIGMVTANKITGPWKKAGSDGMILRPEKWCAGSACGVNNPAFVKGADGNYYLYFKAMPGNDRSRLSMGLAISKRLEGPYIMQAEPVTNNKTAIEDGTAFLWKDSICLITTDNHGIIERGGGLLWTSADGLHFGAPRLAFHPLRMYLPQGVPPGARFIYGNETKFERPQVLMIEGEPKYLFMPSGTSLDGDAGTDVHLLYRE
jgi:hypothetical protein